MTSHEYAEAMKRTAEFLLSKPEFTTAHPKPWFYLGTYWSDKEAFLTAVRALGTVTKKYDGSELKITAGPEGWIYIAIQRSLVCTKVQEEKWECEPLLSPEEEASIEAPAE